MAFGIRSTITGTALVISDSFDKTSSQYYDMLGRVISNDRFIKEGIYIKDNKQVFIVK